MKFLPKILLNVLKVNYELSNILRECTKYRLFNKAIGLHTFTVQHFNI